MKNIWEGVYESFDQVPATGSGHEGDTWISRGIERMEIIRTSFLRGGTMAPYPQFRESLLPLLAAMAFDGKKEISILDFGGGLGFEYYNVLGALPSDHTVDYHIQEMPAVCAAGRDFFNNTQGITFHETLPDRQFDIVHLGSSLHYVEEWQDLVVALCEKAHSKIAFTDLLAGDIPTFASGQNYYDSLLPVWFFNVGEFLQLVEEAGFNLAFKSKYKAVILGEEQDIPQENFESKYRVGQTCSLVFSRKEVA